MNKKFLPSRFVVAIFIIPIVSYIAYFFLQDVVQQWVVSQEDRKDNLEKVLEEELRQNDQDSDGLLDWEERLYGTDLSNQDSDSDGILDGLEVRSGTDPLDPFNKESRKDEIRQSISQNNEYQYRYDESLTMTDILSRDLLLKAMQLKENDLIHNTSAQYRIIEEVLQKPIEYDVPAEHKVFYTQKDITIVPGRLTSLFRDDFFEVYQAQDWDGVESEFSILLAFSEDGKTETLQKLNTNVKVFEQFEKALLEIRVPKELHSLFLRYVNSLHEYNFLLREIIASENDPVVLMTQVTLLENLLKAMELYANTLASIFSRNTI